MKILGGWVKFALFYFLLLAGCPVVFAQPLASLPAHREEVSSLLWASGATEAQSCIPLGKRQDWCSAPYMYMSMYDMSETRN